MFEYTALVDAPVQRFTGIVTGAGPDDERVIVTVRTPAPLDALPGTEAPLLIVAEAAEPVQPVQLVQAEQPEQPREPAGAIPVAPIAPIAAVAVPGPGSIDRPASVVMDRPAPVARPVPRPVTHRGVVARRAIPAPAPRPAIVPALAAIAAAGITAMWWLRKDAHDRSR